MLIKINLIYKSSYNLALYRFNSKFSNSNLKKLLENMPKDIKHIAQTQLQRLKIKEKLQKYVPGKVTLQVLGTGAEGAPKSLYMFTDQSRYLFNCGEGTQRLAHEHKMKLSKLEHIFITYPSWENIGGLPGVSLTIQDVGIPQITLHGPQGLDELYIATKRFVVLKNLSVHMANCSPEEEFHDNVMTVSYVPLIKSSTIEETCNSHEIGVQVQQETVDASTSTRSEKNHRRSRRRSQSVNAVEVNDDDDTDYYAHEISGTRSASQNKSIPANLLETNTQNISMCYVCRLHARPGALSLERCVEQGVPAGPLLGQLKAGIDITLASGKVVRAKDVCMPDDPGPIIIIVDCPDVNYLDSLIENKEFMKYQNTATNPNDLAYIIIHFSPSKIINNTRYKTWVDKFSLSTQHIVLNDSNTCMGSIAVHRIQHKLNMLHKDMFPLLGDCGTKIEQESSSEESLTKKIKSDNSVNKVLPNKTNLTTDIFVQANTFCNIYVRPKKGIDRSEELQLMPSEYIKETMDLEGFPEALQSLKEQLKCVKQATTSNIHPRILFLGTGSCIPNKTRNTSGILIESSENKAFLMDCGEGTYGQIVRFYGYEKAKSILTNLKAVYISHLHADHHIGLVGLLKGRRKALKSLNIEFTPILLLAPRQILTWLNFYDRRFEEIADDFILIPNSDMILHDNKLNSEQKEFFFERLGMTEINTVLVKHCPNSYGVSFTHNSGWKLTYSGDTMPCESLIQLGMNSDLLIHEATMEDELAHEAIVKMHSTTSQAIEIGKKMKAKHILLTHFSQRYAKLPRFNNNFAENVGIAFDNMQVKLSELSVLPLLYPSLRIMFAEHYVELENKAIKRQLKQERSVIENAHAK